MIYALTPLGAAGAEAVEGAAPAAAELIAIGLLRVVLATRPTRPSPVNAAMVAVVGVTEETAAIRADADAEADGAALAATVLTALVRGLGVGGEATASLIPAFDAAGVGDLMIAAGLAGSITGTVGVREDLAGESARACVCAKTDFAVETGGAGAEKGTLTSAEGALTGFSVATVAAGAKTKADSSKVEVAFLVKADLSKTIRVSATCMSMDEMAAT